MITKTQILRAIAFIVRCSGAAAGAYELATALGFPEALWAAMSALIVSQEQLQETRSSLLARILGTLLGICVTITVSEVASRAVSSAAEQMAIAVAICALIAHAFPQLRVAMWTCPVILLAAQPAVPIVVIALRRGGEVILGALVGWLFHWTTEALFAAITRGRAAKTASRHSAPADPAEPEPPRHLRPACPGSAPRS